MGRGLLLVSLGLLVRLGITHFDEIHDAATLLLTRGRGLLALALGLEMIWTLSLANVYRSSLLAFGGGATRRQAVRVSLGSFSLSRVLPGGGAAGSIFAARALVALGNPVPTVVTSMATSWVLSMGSLAAIVLTGTAVAVVQGHVAGSHLLAPIAVLATLAAAALAILTAARSAALRHRIVPAMVRLGARLGVEASAEAWEAQAPAVLSSPHTRFLPVVASAMVSWATDAAALWVVFLAFGERLHPGVLLVGYGLANLINALPELTPGWIGILETTLAGAYAGLGVPAGVALAAVLSYRIISYWLPVAAGAVPGLGMLRGGRLVDRSFAVSQPRHHQGNGRRFTVD